MPDAMFRKPSTSSQTENANTDASISKSKQAPESTTTDSTDRYMMPREVEERLGISPSTRRRWTNRGLLHAYPLGPYYRPGPGDNPEGNRNGSRVRYSEHEVNDLFERIKNGALAEPPKLQDP
ncbi:helix-turn-helix domain-containing protein [Streptomyces arenae]|uniref:helix-turn-helix domain-containing protein n=1 Tax=Streptomyces arenae TaxID=29301 RepID=UPI00265B6F31|nr:helix-turn-helix domain-containing protein [Streptomyces arenae]MCG7202357.1 hypothetical protein [Streptomyces arenae]